MSEQKRNNQLNEVVALENAKKNKLFEVVKNKENNDVSISYDRHQLLEMSMKGYDPLNPEDVDNYFSSKPPMVANRNAIVCGADIYKNLGQSDYKEMLIPSSLEISTLDNDNLFLSQFGFKKSQEFGEVKSVVVENVENAEDYPAFNEIEYRTRLAKVFNAKDIEVNPINELKALNSNSNSSGEMVISNNNAEKVIELIKELKALGFSNEEIKQQVKSL